MWQGAELQVLQADAENRKKADHNYYKTDEEIIVTIWEDLSDDFLSLVGAHFEVIRRLIERLDDD